MDRNLDRSCISMLSRCFFLFFSFLFFRSFLFFSFSFSFFFSFFPLFFPLSPSPLHIVIGHGIIIFMLCLWLQFAKRADRMPINGGIFDPFLGVLLHDWPSALGHPYIRVRLSIHSATHSLTACAHVPTVSYQGPGSLLGVGSWGSRLSQRNRCRMATLWESCYLTPQERGVCTIL